MAALLAGEALEVVDVVPGPHDHLEGRDHLGARRAVAGVAEQPASRATTRSELVTAGHSWSHLVTSSGLLQVSVRMGQ